MIHRLRIPVILLAIGVFLWLIMGARRETAVFGQDIPQLGVAHLDGAVQLDLTVTQPAAKPGDVLQMMVTLRNNTESIQTPQISFQLPNGVHPDRLVMPAGMTMNMQTNALEWVPVLSGNGSQHQFAMSLKVETIQVDEPNQYIGVVLRNEGGEQKAEASLWLGIPPTIEHILNPLQVAVGQPFQLRAATSGSGAANQTWHLGDGRRLDVNDPIVVYSAPGLYEVSLKASNPAGTSTATTTVAVIPHPAAQFAMDDPLVGIDQPVTFINQSGGAAPLTYLWDFGDGATSIELNPMHTYAQAGVYDVHLTVRNEFGQSEAFGQVTVGQPPVADIVVPESAPAGEAMQGLAFGDDSVTRYEWHMGDGRSYEGPQIEHAYNITGDFYITMIAINDFGNTQIGRWIHIDPGTFTLYLPMIYRLEDIAEPELNTQQPAETPINLSEPFIMPVIEVPEGSTPTEQLFININEARRLFNLAPLTNITELNTAAQQQAVDMSLFGHTNHTGTDGSNPADRFSLFNYDGGYSGEATAWGFSEPRQAVEFWVNSPSHRELILNPYATDVGVGYVYDTSTDNFWYWTAEFGNRYGQANAPSLRVQQPGHDFNVLVTSLVNYAWNYTTSLEDGQQFVIYLYTNQGEFPVATVTQPALGTLYSVQLAATDFNTGSQALYVMPGIYEWQVKLEYNGAVIAEGDRRTIQFSADPNNPIPSPTPTNTPTASPTPLVTPTEPIRPIWPTATPKQPTSTPTP